ncbi:MAG: hypothetical protein ACXWV0_01720 [Flavisolibacter sp.]
MRHTFSEGYQNYNMEKRTNAPGGRHENPLPREIGSEEKQKAVNAHDSAEHDMEEDVEFSAQSPNDDLDEREIAQLGEDKNDIV